MSVKLVRGLSLIDASSIVVGVIIGTGVFLKTATMAQYMGSAYWVLAVWIFAGLLSFTGALSYAELAAMMPDAGGEYVFLREGFGKFFGFLYGWMRFWIGGPGSIAAYAVGAATFLSSVMDLTVLRMGDIPGLVVTAIVFIIFFTLINCAAVSYGGKVQTFFTFLKVFMLFGLIVGVFLWSPPHASVKGVEGLGSGWGPFPGFSAFGSALLAALWAYDGWNNLTMVAGEVKSPQKNIPLALGFGMMIILVIYFLVNSAYFYALPFSEVIISNSNAYPNAIPVATKAVMTFLGASGVMVLSIAFVISALGAMNGSILTCARVPYAMAQDRVFFKKLSSVSAATSVPVVSILVQGLMSVILAMSGTFDQLTDYVIFSSWIFYAMVTGVVFVLRKRRADVERPYKTWGYPVVPMVFIVVAILLLINTIVKDPKSTGIGMAIILLGIPVYFYFQKQDQIK